jgi:hypothetical protein
MWPEGLWSNLTPFLSHFHGRNVEHHEKPWCRYSVSEPRFKPTTSQLRSSFASRSQRRYGRGSFILTHWGNLELLLVWCTYVSFTGVNFLQRYFCVSAYIEVFLTLSSGCRLRCLSYHHKSSMYSRNLDTSVSILFSQHAGQPRNRSSVPSRDIDFLFSSCSKPSILPSVHQGIFLWR